MLFRCENVEEVFNDCNKVVEEMTEQKVNFKKLIFLDVNMRGKKLKIIIYYLVACSPERTLI